MFGELSGFTVGVTAARTAQEQATLLRQLGARVLVGQVMRIVPGGDGSAMRRVTADLISSPPHTIVFLSETGVRLWLDFAEIDARADDLIGSLAKSRVIACGAGVARLVASVGLGVTWQCPSGLIDEISDYLVGLDLVGRRVAVQMPGMGGSEIIATLRRTGARALPVIPYVWGLPEVRDPALKLIRAAVDGDLDAMTFTSAAAVDSLFAIAASERVREPLVAALDERVFAAATGSAAEQRLNAVGVDNVVRPNRPRLGAMIGELSNVLAQRRRRVMIDGVEVLIQGDVVTVSDGRIAIELTGRERAVLSVLAEQPGAIVSKDVLHRRIWADGVVDVHAIEVAVGRLRRRLEPIGDLIETTMRRGYRLRVDAFAY